MLDRIDGIIFAIPSFFYYFNLYIMKKKIAILGSTGSIGKSTLEVIKKDKKNFECNFTYQQIIIIKNLSNKQKNLMQKMF